MLRWGNFKINVSRLEFDKKEVIINYGGKLFLKQQLCR